MNYTIRVGLKHTALAALVAASRAPVDVVPGIYRYFRRTRFAGRSRRISPASSSASVKPLRQQAATVARDGIFSTTLPLRENDVYLLQLNAAR